METAERIRAVAGGTPTPFEGISIIATTSIGVALVDPSDRDI